MHLRIDAPLVALEAVVRVAFEALHRPPGDVQLAHQRGLVAEAGEVHREQHLVVGQGVVNAVHAVPGGQLSGQHACAARRTDRHVHVAALEHHAGGGQAVQGGSGDGGAAIATQGVPALLIAHQEQDIGSFHRLPTSLPDRGGDVKARARCFHLFRRIGPTRLPRPAARGTIRHRSP